MSLCMRIAVILGLISLLGCVKDIKDLKDVPDDKWTVKAGAPVRQNEEEAAQLIKKRLQEGGRELRIDPWVPPPQMSVEKLPRALRSMPKDQYGYPDWTAAVRRGLLVPMDSLGAASKKDVFMFAEGD